MGPKWHRNKQRQNGAAAGARKPDRLLGAVAALSHAGFRPLTGQKWPLKLSAVLVHHMRPSSDAGKKSQNGTIVRL